MTSPEMPDAPQHARDMEEPYTGPVEGHGIGTLGGVTRGGLRSAMEFAEMILDTVREGLLVLDLSFYVQAANESFYEMFGITREQIEGHLVFDLQDGRWDLPDLRDLLDRILPERHAFDGFQIEYENADEERRVLMLNARQVNHHQLILLAIEDVTERVRAKEDLEARVQSRTQQVRQLASRLSVAEQEERKRISQLLHDDLQQILTGASLMLSTVPKQRSDEARDEIARKTQQALGQAIELTRTLIVQLSPAVLETDRLTDVLQWLAEQKRALFGLEVTIEGSADVVHPALRTVAFHLTREVLFNVAKHADTKQARITVTDTDDHVVVRIEDDGAGFDLSTLDGGTGFGLTGVRERLEIIGGRCEVASAPGQGTRVSLFLPKELDTAA